MKKLKSFILIGFSLLGLSSCSDMIYDDLEDCPTGIRVNMIGIPLTLTPTAGGTPYNSKSQYDYIKDATFFVYDSNGTLVHYYNAGSNMLENNYSTFIPVEAGTYSVYCWTGASTNGYNYDFDGIVAGTSTKSDFSCNYNLDAFNTTTYLSPMGYGKVENVSVQSHAITDADMDVISNKKTINCIFRYVKKNTVDGETTVDDINMADYLFYIQSDNRRYDMDNNIIAYPTPLKYGNISTPIVSALTDTDESGNAESITLTSVAINTLKMVDGDSDTRFIVRDPDGNNICNIPIVKYLSMFAASLNSSGITNSMTTQEYLDYNDEYSIIFNVVKESTSTTEIIQEDNARFRISSIQIADWILNLENDSATLNDFQNVSK